MSDGRYGFILRNQVRKGFCRGCEQLIEPKELMVYSYTYLNRGGAILICLPCAEKIGKLYAMSKEELDDRK